MPFEAYTPPRKRQMGLPVEPEFSSLVQMSGGLAASGAARHRRSRVPIGPVILIAVGMLFLLDTLGILHAEQIWRFWPLILIGLGIHLSCSISRASSARRCPAPESSRIMSRK